MTFVPTRTDSDAYSAVDGVDVAFGTPVEATAGGFGVKNTVKGIDTVEILDALPLNRASVQKAVEAGSAALAATPGGAAAGFTAIDFSVNVDYVDDTEVDASPALDSEIITSALV
jgi:hypothetical protein